MYYVYILKSQKSKILYVGYTNNLRLRMHQHNGEQSLYSKKYLPWTLVYYEAYLSATDARKREKQIKEFKSAYGFLKRRIGDSLTRT